MMDDPRDDGFARAARLATQRAAATAADVCPSVETLAGLADDELEAAERNAVLSHLADCERCRAVVAAVVRTIEPPLEAVALPERAPGQVVAFPPQRHAKMWWWVTPVAAATAAVLAWVAVRPLEWRRQAPEEVAVARNEPRATPPLVEIPTAEPVAQPAPPPPAGELFRQSRDAQVVDARSDRARSAAEPAAVAEVRGPETDGLRAESVGAASPSAPAPVLEEAVSSNEARNSAAPAAVATAPPSLRSPAAPPLLADAVSEAATPRPGSLGAQKMSSSLDRPTATGTSNGHSWRSSPGRFEWSRDGGQTWASATLQAAEGRLAASPQADVWWVVTTDGRVFHIAGTVVSESRPARSAAIQSIASTAREHAVVTDTAGQRHETRDGGRTWRLADAR